MLHQLTYISTAKPGITPAEVRNILLVSRLNNAAAGLTGLLVHDGCRFLQALEGERTSLNTAYARIRDDARHRAIVLLSSRDVVEREFGDWAMASEQVETVLGAGTVAETVDALAAQVHNPNTRALFTSFARLQRAA